MIINDRHTNLSNLTHNWFAPQHNTTSTRNTTFAQDATIDFSAAKTSPEAKATEMMKEQFGALASDKDKFHALMKQVYGDSYDAKTAEGLRQKALAGDFSFLPEVKFVSRETLQGGNGAYNAEEGVVYIAEDLKGSELAASTFVEEAGHHLDTLVNKSDTQGDEGEMFRRLMAGEKLTASQINGIRNENDHGTITVDGKTIAVEFWNPVKSIKNAAKKVGGAIKDAAKAVGGAIKKGASKAYDGMMWAADKVGSAMWKPFEAGVWVAGKMREGVIEAGKAIGKAGKAVGVFFEDLGKGLYNAAKALPGEIKSLATKAYDGMMWAADKVSWAMWKPFEGGAWLAGKAREGIAKIF